MLRSFDYAARHLLADYRADPQREYRATEWAERNRDGLLRRLRSGQRVRPRATQSVLLRAFETDKAVYEVLYEARNRPSWLRSPCRRSAGSPPQETEERSRLTQSTRPRPALHAAHPTARR